MGHGLPLSSSSHYIKYLEQNLALCESKKGNVYQFISKGEDSWGMIIFSPGHGLRFQNSDDEKNQQVRMDNLILKPSLVISIKKKWKPKMSRA